MRRERARATVKHCGGGSANIMTPPIKVNKDFIDALINKIEACRGITSFDRNVYINAYGLDAVAFIEDTCEAMPDTSNPNNRIAAMLNIAYDKGFNDACQIVINVLIDWGVLDERSFS